MNDIKTIAVKKISPSDTLKSIKVGDTVIIKGKHIKPNVARSTMSRLSKNGYSFYSTSCPEGLIVKRLK